MRSGLWLAGSTFSPWLYLKWKILLNSNIYLKYRPPYRSKFWSHLNFGTPIVWWVNLSHHCIAFMVTHWGFNSWTGHYYVVSREVKEAQNRENSRKHGDYWNWWQLVYLMLKLVYWLAFMSNSWEWTHMNLDTVFVE